MKYEKLRPEKGEKATWVVLSLTCFTLYVSLLVAAAASALQVSL